MGNTHHVPLADFRVQRCINLFEIPECKIRDLWLIFLTRAQHERWHMLLFSDFLRIIDYANSPLVPSFASLLDFRSTEQMNFGEFVELVCTISFFEEDELLKYFFFVLDPFKIGSVDIKELKHFLLAIHQKDRAQIRESIEFLEQRAQSQPEMSFKDVIRFRRAFPYSFHPLFRLRTQIIERTLGAYWCETHKLRRAEAKEAQRAAEEASRRATELRRAEQDALLADEQLLKLRMGWRYYAMPWTRAAQRKRMMRIAAIDDEMDSRVSAKPPSRALSLAMTASDESHSSLSHSLSFS